MKQLQPGTSYKVFIDVKNSISTTTTEIVLRTKYQGRKQKFAFTALQIVQRILKKFHSNLYSQHHAFSDLAPTNIHPPESRIIGTMMRIQLPVFHTDAPITYVVKSPSYFLP